MSSDALNIELNQLADADRRVNPDGETQIHLLAAKGVSDDVLMPAYMVDDRYSLVESG